MGRRFDKKRYNPRSAPRGRRITVQEETTLLPLLLQILNQQSKSSVKAMLGHGQISVNGKVTTQFDTPLKPKDILGISYERGKVPFSHPQLKIVYEDDYFILVNKKEGLLSVGNAKERERTAVRLLSDYVKKTDSRNKVFILHRLDRETSGLMLLARTKGIQEAMLSEWNYRVKEQSFVAVVEGRPEKEKDLLVSIPLMDTAQNDKSVIISENEGEEAVARYKILRGNEDYSLLEVGLESGRRNQVRVQLANIGNPIAGDKRNGAETSPAGRLMLHARRLVFIHPDSGVKMEFDTQIPHPFTALTK